MLLVIESKEVDRVLSTIESKVVAIQELTKDGFNAEQECLELLKYVQIERESVQLPSMEARRNSSKNR